MNILLLGAGGGGGNILRSLKALFRADLTVAQKTDPKYAERLRRAVTTRFLETNAFSLADVPPEERLLIGSAGSRRFGSRHDPRVARAAFEESREDVEALISNYGVVVLVASGGKGTGAGTLFPLAEIARRQRKLVIPIFVRPSFEHHEVEKQRYDHALGITRQLDEAKIRFIEILNERGYVVDDPQPQALVWERMNRPIARGLRGLLYVLSDLSQVDPSDLSALFAGQGRLRMGFAEIDPQPGREPGDLQIDAAARACWDDSFYAFRGSVGTSLICIQGDWSNVVDAKIKSRLAKLAIDGTHEHPYNPLYARAARVPKPWGVTAIFAEHTGETAPLDLDWTPPSRSSWLRRAAGVVEQPATEPAPPLDVPASAGDSSNVVVHPAASSTGATFSTFWEFAVAINRQDAVAIAIAGNGHDPHLPVNGLEVRKLLNTVWFRSVFQALSERWRERLLDALVGEVVLPNHSFRSRRGVVALQNLDYSEIREIYSKSFVPDATRPELELLLNVGRLWGADALRRFSFDATTPLESGSKLGALLQGFRSGR